MKECVEKIEINYKIIKAIRLSMKEEFASGDIEVSKLIYSDLENSQLIAFEIWSTEHPKDKLTVGVRLDLWKEINCPISFYFKKENVSERFVVYKEFFDALIEKAEGFENENCDMEIYEYMDINYLNSFHGFEIIGFDLDWDYEEEILSEKISCTLKVFMNGWKNYDITEDILERRKKYDFLLNSRKKFSMESNQFDIYWDGHLEPLTDDMFNIAFRIRIKPEMINYREFWLIMVKALKRFSHKEIFNLDKDLIDYEIDYFSNGETRFCKKFDRGDTIKLWPMKNYIEICAEVAFNTDSQIVLKAIHEKEKRLKKSGLKEGEIISEWEACLDSVYKEHDFNKPILDLESVRDLYLLSFLSSEWNEFDGLLVLKGITDNFSYPSSRRRRRRIPMRRQNNSFHYTEAVIELLELANALFKVPDRRITRRRGPFGRK